MNTQYTTHGQWYTVMVMVELCSSVAVAVATVYSIQYARGKHQH